MQRPDDDVTTVVPPLLAVLVVPLTMPLPAEIATPLAPRPPCEEATAQRPFGPALPPVTTVLLEPPELLTLAELLVCAAAIAAAKHVRVPATKMAFTTNLMVFWVNPAMRPCGMCRTASFPSMG